MEGYNYLPGCECPECTFARAREAEAKRQATIDKLKQAAMEALVCPPGVYGKSPAKSVLDQYREDFLKFGNSMIRVERVPPNKWMSVDFAFDEYSSNVEPDKPKHRKDVKVVAKAVKMRNEDAIEHADEAVDMLKEANDILSAADKFSGKTVYDVRVEAGWDNETRVTFVLKPINAEQTEANREEYIDKPLFDAFNLSMQTLSLAVQGMLQKTGRGLFADATMAMHRLSKPEMTARAEAAKAFQAGAQQGPEIVNAGRAVEVSKAL
jgi:hypothetical protein